MQLMTLNRDPEHVTHCLVGTEPSCESSSASPSQFMMVPVEGDSMEPTLPNGHLVMVDTRAPAADGVWGQGWREEIRIPD